MFPHQNFHKYTWTSPDEKTHNQIDHILIDRRWHSSKLDVRSFRGADCDIDHYLVFAKFRECLAVSKTAQKFDWERLNLRKLNELEVRKEYEIEITNRFSALGNLSNDEEINRAWENIKENIKTLAKESLGLHESKQHKPWCDEECIGFRSKETVKCSGYRNQNKEKLADISGAKRRHI